MESHQENEAIGNNQRKMRWALYVRYFLLLFIPLMVLLIGIAATIYHTEVNADIDLLLAHEAEENTVNHLKLVYALEEAVADLRWMANRKELAGIFDGENSAQRNELAQEFLDLGLFSARKAYGQFRILDDTGMEILRVQLGGDDYTVAAESELQDKSDRYYFTEAINLDQGLVYMSDLDLNMEHGKIEVPYKPVIRFATPIFDDAGQKRGVLVTNLLAKPILDGLISKFITPPEHNADQLDENHPSHHYLLIDRNGHYLRGITGEDEWGGSLGKDPMFPKQYPTVWAEMAERNIAIHRIGQSYLLSRSVHPCADPECSYRSSDVVDVATVMAGPHSPFLWKLVAVIEPGEILGIKRHWFTSVAALVMVLSLIGGLGSFALARAMVRRVLAEKEVLKTRNRLKSILDNTSSVVFLKDLDGHFLMINKQFEDLFHITESEIIGKTDFDLFPAEAAQAFQELDRQALEAGKPIEGEELVPQDDGIHTYISVKFPLVGEDGKPFGVGGIATDITDRKKAEEEAQKFKTISEQASYGVAITDLRNKYLYVNASFAVAHGYSPSEMVGTHAGDYRAETSKAETQALMDKYRLDGEFTNMEVWRTHKDGHDFPLLVSGMIVKDPFGNPICSAISASDISELKQTEAKLKDSEEQLRNLFDNMAEGAGFSDLDDNFLFTNSAMERIHGVGPGELIGRNVREFLVPEQHERLTRETARRIYGETSTYHATITRPDGQERVVMITGSPRRDGEGNVIGTYGIVHDITEKREWELALKESEQHYRELVEATDAVAWEMDWESGQITYMAPQIEQLTGYPAEDWVDMETWLAKIHENDRDWVYEFCSTNTLAGKDHELEYRFVDAKGLVVWVRELVSVVMGNDGPEKIRGLLLDITQVRNATIRANREYSKLKLMVSTMEDGVAFADAEDTVVEINESFCRLTGISQDDVLGKSVVEIHQGFSERVQELFNQVIEGYKNETSFEPYIVQSELNGKDIIFRVHPVFRDGHYDGVMTSIIDVSEIIRAQKKAEEASRAKSMFLANITHELRTPLTIINGFAEILLESPENLSELQTNYISQIGQGGQHLLMIIGDLLDMARIEAGRIDLNFLPSDLIPICDSALDMAIPEKREKTIEVTKEYPATPVICVCDYFRIRQVVINLLANAWKFTKEGTITLCLEEEGNEIRISIKDTGIGMRKSSIGKLLEPFEQAQNKFETEFVGAGLGLALTKGIVEAHGGRLSVKSELGVGSTFSVILPKQPNSPG